MLVNNISHDLVTERAKRDWFAYWKHYKKTKMNIVLKPIASIRLLMVHW